MKNRENLDTRRWEDGRQGNTTEKKAHRGPQVGNWWDVFKMDWRFSGNLGCMRGDSRNGKASWGRLWRS